MAKFLPYEAYIYLPQYHTQPYNVKCLLQCVWRLPANFRRVRGHDVYDLSYKLWLRMDELRDKRGSLELVRVYAQFNTREKGREGQVLTKGMRGLEKDTFLSVSSMMKPTPAYNPYLFYHDASLPLDQPLTPIPLGPLNDLAEYATSKKIHVAYREVNSEPSMSFWYEGETVCVFVKEHVSWKMWTPHKGITDAVFPDVIAELRGMR